MSDGDWSGALERAQHNAPFLALAIARLPELAALLATGDGEGALAFARAAGADAGDVGVALRRERLALALALAVGDLAGAFPLSRVVGELSAFADRALDVAIRDALQRRVPGASADGFFALALGKHGAGELNYSSDIDPILLYDPTRMARRERDDPGEAAVRVARQIVQTLGAVDGEGYVFRVDLRLRPASEVSPLAIPVDAALTHYESAALAWERAAFIRARAAAGDVAAGEEFLSQIRPFVWRKSLDFGAIAEIGRLTRRIRAHHGKVEAVGPGFDLKRGRGGIREIEFFAQTHQLIHGGRHPALRVRGTRDALDALAAGGFITGEDAATLGAAYDRLRTIEHRLQMVNDQQTHSLPADRTALDRVAWLDGLADGEALLAELGAITGMVGERYDRLIEADRATSPGMAPLPAGEALAGQLAALGFADAGVLADRIEGWRNGSIRALRSDAAITALDAVQPALLAAFAIAPEPERALVRWEQLIARLPSAVNLFRLLQARPGLLDQLVRILSLAPPLADELARRADLLDALIDQSALDLPPGVEALVAEFGAVDECDDYQLLLDRVRRKVGERRFALGVQLIEGAHDPVAISAGLARVAEAAIRVLGAATVCEFERAHGRIAGSEMAMLGLGRLGGGALTHASDLDVVFVFTGDYAAESDGRRPLGGSLYYNRLAQRIVGALSAPTAEGALYEVDTRLRPQGEQGPIACSLDAFARYQREDAWTWEHMALARARPVFGSPEAGEALQRVIGEVLGRERDADGLRADVLAMRNRMAAHKQPAGPLDAKLLRGGLVDIEFLIHGVQLRDRIGLHPQLDLALAELVSAGALPAELELAFAFLARLLVAARLLAPDGRVPERTGCAALAKACGCSDWKALEAGLAAARQAVAAAWHQVYGESLEIE